MDTREYLDLCLENAKNYVDEGFPGITEELTFKVFQCEQKIPYYEVNQLKECSNVVDKKVNSIVKDIGNLKLTPIEFNGFSK